MSLFCLQLITKFRMAVSWRGHIIVFFKSSVIRSIQKMISKRVIHLLEQVRLSRRRLSRKVPPIQKFVKLQTKSGVFFVNLFVFSGHELHAHLHLHEHCGGLAILLYVDRHTPNSSAITTPLQSILWRLTPVNKLSHSDTVMCSYTCHYNWNGEEAVSLFHHQDYQPAEFSNGKMFGNPVHGISPNYWLRES